MPFRIIRLSGLPAIALLFATSVAGTAASGLGDAAASVLPLREPTIFVADFREVGVPSCAGERPETCTAAVRVRVSRVLKDRDGMALAPCEIATTITRWMGEGDGRLLTFWSGAWPRQGESYLIISARRASLADMIRSPAAADVISLREDPVAEVEFILHEADLSIGDQATAAAAWLGSGTRHGRHLADYAAALLEAGAPSDTYALASAVTSARADAFSDSGRSELVYRLSVPNGSQGASPNRLRVFVVLVARYFCLDGEKVAQTGLTQMQRAILGVYFQRILDSGRARAVWKAEVTGEDLTAFRAKARGLAAGPKVSEAYRQGIARFLELSEGQ